jgi:hypothetical protein|tara:strand:- start:105 stop:350 length:246 start_codon:yes stop_codon:yes gene_type:complete
VNKSQRREQAGRKAMEVAMASLKRIEAHEKECGERWAEAIMEIKALRAASDAHSERWEKLAWMVVGVVLITTAAHFIEMAL